jgi:hypothetical protein
MVKFEYSVWRLLHLRHARQNKAGWNFRYDVHREKDNCRYMNLKICHIPFSPTLHIVYPHGKQVEPVWISAEI